MRQLVSKVLLIVLVALGATAAGSAAQADMVVLRNAQDMLELDGPLDAWLEPAQAASIAEVAAAPERFTAHPPRLPFALRDGTTLWIRLRVLRAPGESDAWIMDIPMPYLDSVTLYQRDFSGRWITRVSGDTIAHASWSLQGLHPTFRVHFAGSEPQQLYLQIRNMSQIAVPVRFARESTYESRRMLESLLMGWVLGLLLTLAGFSLVRYIAHRDRLDLGAMAYALLVGFAIAQVNGVMAATVWSNLPWLSNNLTKIASVLGVGGSLLFMRQLYALSVHFHRFDMLLGVTGWATMVASLGVFVLAPEPANLVETLAYVVSTSVALVAAVLSWRQKSPIGYWLLLATVPQSLGILWLAAETAGMVQPVWEVRYYTSLCAALSVAVLMFALRRTTQERQDRIDRANHLATQDALTGLLKRDVFDLHLEEALKRVRENREPVALAVVSLANYPQIVETFGPVIGEQCELRAVVKLHRVLRDIDPASRLGTGQFALLLQGLGKREHLSQRMVKLIASGLTPQPGLKPPVPLQFHVACAMLHERSFNFATLMDDLRELLTGIAPGSRRPIRFLEPALPNSLLNSSSLPAQQSPGAPDIALP